MMDGSKVNHHPHSGVLWSEEKHEPVKVDQKALVDKVLSRYSAKFAVIRELLQNADDAKADHVFIRFETESFKQVDGALVDGPDLQSKVCRWTIQNNGKPFDHRDWGRLKTIADGNPDEHKIGAFGVGFYSVFSETREPLVISGGKRMRFYWDDNQLLVAQSHAVDLIANSNLLTTFELPVHEPSPLRYTFIDIGRFLAASFAFLANLKAVTVAFDSHVLLRLSKTMESPEQLPLLNPRTNERLMKANTFNKTEVVIKAEVAELVYQTANSTPCPKCSPISPSSLQPRTSQYKMFVWSANATVALDPKLEAGLKQATKKKDIPVNCQVKLIYIGRDEYDAIKGEHDHSNNSVGCLFQALKPDLKRPEAYVYIGLATTQTTGIAGAIAAQFVPTVERELIDLENDHVKIWNKELLYVGGHLARMIYEHEMALIKSCWSSESFTSLQSKSLHAIQFFAFRKSTPMPGVSLAINEAFLDNPSQLPIISSIGVFPACDVRDFDRACASWIKNVPLLPSCIADHPMVDVLKDKHVVKAMKFPDLMKEVNSRFFEEHEMVSCLMWVMACDTDFLQETETWSSFLAATRFLHKESGRLIHLSNIRAVLDVSPLFTPPEAPLPDDTLPFTTSRSLPVEALTTLFSWRKLSVVEWLATLASSAPGTNGWQNANIMNYLVSHRLTDDEVTLLQQLPIFVKEGNGIDVERCKASDLCRPVEKLRGLGLPALAWGTPFPWNDVSMEAQLLDTLGLRPRPDLILLLKIVEGADANTCEAVLQYVSDNWRHYEADYEGEDERAIIAELKFIPVVDHSGFFRIVKVSEAYTAHQCQVMGFSIVLEKFRAHAAKLKVSAHPPTSDVVSSLKKHCPKDCGTAKRCFAYLFSRLSGCDTNCQQSHSHQSALTEDQISELSNLPFVPVPTSQMDTQMLAPKNCFVGKPSSEFYSKLFSYIDFGELGNSFLSSCQAKREPTVDDIALALIDNPGRFYDLAGAAHGHLRELRNIASKYEEISPEVLLKLRTAPILLGSPYESYESTAGSHDLEGEYVTYSDDLLRPDQVVIVDNERDYSIFRDVEQLFHAPKGLEQFYEKLGSPRLSSIIREEYDRQGPEQLKHPHRERIRKLVIERLDLFLQQRDGKRRKMFHTMQQGNNFQVKVFEGLQMTKVLDFGGEEVEHSCKTTAGCMLELPKFELLLISDRLDYFDLACCVLKYFYDNPTSHVCVLLMTLLSTSLQVLRDRGYPVAHLIQHDNQQHSYQFSLEDSLDISESDDEIDSNQSNTWSNMLNPLRKVLTNRKRTQPVPIKREDIGNYLKSAITAHGRTQQYRAAPIVSFNKDKMNDSSCGLDCDRPLRHVTRGAYGVSVGNEVSDDELLEQGPCIECFINKVIMPLQKIFDFPSEHIRVLYDPGCSDLLAFNWAGVIYLNLHHFEREHFPEVERNLAKALLAWYFALAHEFTHNLVPTHNADFEYFFSRMCQCYALALFKLAPLQDALNDDTQLYLGMEIS